MESTTAIECKQTTERGKWTMSKVSKVIHKNMRKIETSAKKVKVRYVKQYDQSPQQNVVLILPDGTRKEVTAEEYKKKGRQLWKDATTAKEPTQIE